MMGPMSNAKSTVPSPIEPPITEGEEEDDHLDPDPSRTETPVEPAGEAEHETVSGPGNRDALPDRRRDARPIMSSPTKNCDDPQESGRGMREPGLDAKHVDPGAHQRHVADRAEAGSHSEGEPTEQDQECSHALGYLARTIIRTVR